MPKLTDRELAAIVDGEFSAAMGAEGGDISKERKRAWSYYLSEKFGNEIEGQSEIVTSDVSDVVDSIMPSMLRLFTTAENLCQFDPVDETDIAGAQQESDRVSFEFFKKNDAFIVLYNWFFDAFVQKNGITKAWWDEDEDVTTETYQNLTDVELMELLDDEELEPIERSETVTDMGTLHDVSFRRVTTAGKVSVDNVPPEEFRISSDARSLNPSKARFVGQERDVTRSDLIAMGFDRGIVDGLPASSAAMNDEEDNRHWRSDEELVNNSNDRSQDLITLREAYIRLDDDGDGRAELRQIFVAGNEILSNEPADRQPFHVISPQPLPHQHFGRATAEKVMDTQKTSSVLLRQVLDNLYHTNNPGHAVWEQGIGENTLDDLLTRRVGSYARFARPVGESYAPMTVPFTAAASFPMLEFFDKQKRDRTGIGNDSEGLDPMSLKNIQTTVMAQANDLSRMKIEAIARIFAETGLKSLFLHIHELLQKHQDKTEVLQLRNQFVPVSPSEWRTRKNMTVNIGLGIGTREQNLLHLNAIKEIQAQMIEAGGLNLTVTPKNVYNTAAEYVKNANLKAPSMFFTDPGDKPAPPPSGEQEQLQQMQMQLQQRQQELDAQKQEIQQAKLMLEQQKENLRHQVEVADLERKTQADRDKYDIAMEQIQNQLTEMELKFDTNVPGAKV